MRAEIRRADESWEVLAAAASWRQAGAIDDRQLAAIRIGFADDRRRTRAGFRLLFFTFTFFGGLGLWGFLAASLDLMTFGSGERLGNALLMAALGLCAAGATEVATRLHRLRRFGVEEGLVALGLCWAAGAGVLLVKEAGMTDRTQVLVIGILIAICAIAAAARWGIPLTGAVGGVGLFLALYALPGARWLWIGAGVALATAAIVGASGALGAPDAEGDGVGPAHRRRIDELFVVATLALYCSVHVAGLSYDVFSLLTRSGGMTRNVPELLEGLAWLAMFALPAALIALGVTRRDRLALSLGALLGLASSISGADALDLEPVWLVLGVAGLLLLGFSFGARRLFDARCDRIVGGFTDRALFDSRERRSFLEIAATLAALAPEPRQAEAPTGFVGKGGDFGGGGASSEF